MASTSVWDPFMMLRKRNKVLFTVIIAFSVIVFWKGVWGLADIVFDQWLFRGHLFWSSVAATIVGFAILSASGLVIKKLV